MPVGWNPSELAALGCPAPGFWGTLAKQGFKRHRSAQPRRDLLHYTCANLGGRARLIVGFSEGRRSDYLEDLVEIFNSYLIWALVLGLGGGILFSRRALAPLRDLTATVTEVAAGDVAARVPLRSGNTELNELVVQFNGMLARIEQLVVAMRDALDNVAHDLRTPLSCMRISIERALRTSDVALLKEALLDCAEETERIQAMVTATMNISEAESGLMQLEPDLIDLGALLTEIVELFEYASAERQVLIKLEVPEGLSVWADPVKLRQMLMNLVDNAIKYGRPGGRVGLAARPQEGGVVIEVSDDGPGITPQEIERIFERLYRGDASRCTRGLGLGLALVRAYAQAHGGSVRVVSSADFGSTFTLFLPEPPCS
ncbi:MAG: Alkaline phosphatase synthesis sensor protein PhoR [Deltaproteobacteria bacterium ADurb.Bin510]|nr:MAG: Alkaline phosphatase synthesis sensor protein PhoR [Deltaproteobacteria bacterium ADurb.Bin510]